MAEKPKIVGYGLCGSNQPYLENTLKEFKRLCDETIILLNNASQHEKQLVKKYGFSYVEDNREWGKLQWKIKEDFIVNHVSKLKPNLCVCLDMDEVFDKNLTKEGLYKLYASEFPAFYFFIVNLWDEGYNAQRNFWNIRAWKWIPSYGFKYPQKNLHCGLAPEWVWARGFYAPYLLKHYGLKDKERREKKAERYKKYDPDAKYIAKEYYQSLESSPQVTPFDEDELHQHVVDYVYTYKQTFVNHMDKKEELVIIETLSGEQAYVPKEKLSEYTKQGCKYIGGYNDIDETLDETLSYIENEEATQEESFMCGDCSKEFATKKQLHGHRLGAHKTAKWTFEKKKQ